MITVLVADDHALMRNVLRRMLETAADMLVVAVATNGQEAIEQAIFYCPHVVLMDISMPVMDGVEATLQIRKKCPQTRVVMLSAYNTSPYVKRSLLAGALGYVLKDVIGKDLVAAVRSVSRGDRYFSKQVTGIAERYLLMSNIPVD